MTDPLYSADFYASHRDGARRSALVVGRLLLDWLGPRSVVDVGCGQGTWLAALTELGVTDVLGVDGAHVDRGALEIPPDRFVAHDLATPLRLERRFDLVISLEVAEHLPEEAAARFVESLAGLGDAILFSAAAPHQGGRGHCNEQWPGYWADLFAGHGLRCVDCLRRRLWSEPAVDWWYAQNALVFVTDEVLEGRPRLRVEDPLAGMRPLALVHPTRFLEWVEWGTEVSKAT